MFISLVKTIKTEYLFKTRVGTKLKRQTGRKKQFLCYILYGDLFALNGFPCVVLKHFKSFCSTLRSIKSRDRASLHFKF